MARASCAVNATNRWAITGTPIQNRVTDFSSLLEFLKIYPFSNPKVFDTEIAKPWLKSGDKDITRMKKLVNCISLCRTKAIIDLPKREDLIRNLKFSAAEQECYDKAREKTIRKLDAALSNNPLHTGQYLNALQWLNELRLLCNHGLVHSNREVHKTINITPQDTHVWNKATANKAFETIVCANEASCSVCGNILSAGAGEGSSSEIPKPYLAKCLTLICGSCVKDSPNGSLVPTCSHTPMCKSVEVSWTPDIATNTAKGKTLPDIPEEHISTKLKTLMIDLTTCPKGEKRYSDFKILLKGRTDDI
jgi:SWI/SNF-related matrix-associated actin-dependent regulator of chromatin subfamily A3